MPDPTTHPAPAHDTSHEHVGVMRRVYAIVLILVVLFVSGRAIQYLIVNLLVPYSPPEQITRIPSRLTEEVWKTKPDRFLGSMLAENPRAPLSHYHQIQGWFQPDPVNDCTRSGCHGPMPHSNRKETRAFLNMHATSLHCGVCHMESATEPLPLAWYNLRTGRKTEAPALLQAYGWLISEEGQAQLAEPTYQFQQRLIKLLSKAADQAAGDPTIRRLAEAVAGPRFSSPTFTGIVQTVLERLPSHFRGEYGAKLALLDERGNPLLGHPNTEATVQRFLDLRDELSPTAQVELLAKVHPQRRPDTLRCSDCHTRDSTMITLGTVGYPPERILTLQEGWIYTAIEHNKAGRPLYLPGFVAPRDEEGAATNPDLEVVPAPEP